MDCEKVIVVHSIVFGEELRCGAFDSIDDWK
jgi:hypothetical protein